jgi:hypothetical protein
LDTAQSRVLVGHGPNFLNALVRTPFSTQRLTFSHFTAKEFTTIFLNLVMFLKYLVVDYNEAKLLMFIIQYVSAATLES